MVDAKNFLNNYCSRDELRDRGIGVDENDSRDTVPLDETLNTGRFPRPFHLWRTMKIP